ncbi:MAG: hypothetical protein WCD54_14210, partial [Pseudolabrys sp.]
IDHVGAELRDDARARRQKSYFSSWACAGSSALNAMAVARHNGGNIRDSVLIMSVPFRAGASIFYVRLVCGGKC